MENNPIEDKNQQIPVIGVPIVNGLHWLERLVGSIDYPVKNFVIINNSGDKLFTTNLEHKVKAWGETNDLVEEFHLINFPSNMGVAFAWNCIIKSFLLEPYWIISNHDTAFTPGLLEEMYKLSPFALTTNDIDLEYGLLLLFSYEYFEHFHKILQKYYRNMEFNEELSELKKIAKI